LRGPSTTRHVVCPAMAVVASVTSVASLETVQHRRTRDEKVGFVH
jgi:hypothetical protein